MTEWIDWNGKGEGEIPVGIGENVDVRWRDGRVFKNVQAMLPNGRAYRWDHDGGSDDIVAYRRLIDTQPSAHGVYAAPDPINSPTHYTSHPSGIQPIDIAEHMSFCLGNVIKYLLRREFKGQEVSDLKKAANYIAIEIARRSKEVWAQIQTDDRYEISTLGRVRRVGSSDFRKPVVTKNGYATFSVVREGKHRLHYIHREVAEAFIGPVPEGFNVCHSDGDRLNNAFWNLRVADPMDNAADRVIHGTLNEGERAGQSVLTVDQVEAIRAIDPGSNTAAVAERFSVSVSTIRRIWNDEAWVTRRSPMVERWDAVIAAEKNEDIREVLKIVLPGERRRTTPDDLKKAEFYIKREIARREMKP